MRALLGMNGIVLLALVAAYQPASAQQMAAAAPGSLEELLRQAETAAMREQTVLERTAAEFRAASEEEQEQKREAVERALEERKAQAEELSSRFSENEIRIGNLNRDLSTKARSLGVAELFGLARQAAGDAAVAFRQSLTSAEFRAADGVQNGRAEFLQAFAGARAVPTADELERLWRELHREMTAQGQVVRFNAEVVQPNGEPAEAEVIRIGSFTALSDGRFLTYIPRLETLSVLPRQLPRHLMNIAADFSAAQEGYVPAVVDHTRGVLIGLYVERPTWLERIELGESVGYVIIAVGIAGLLAFFVQLVHLIVVRVRVGKQLRDLDAPRPNNPLGRVLLAFRGDAETIERDADVAELRISEAVLREVPKLERFQAFLRLAVAAGPLLGLIGTVVGMIVTFQSITESGSSDPRLMASGIGQAMIATVLGLGIAIPLLFANALLNALSRTVVQILDEQSAGILAESMERRRHAG